MRRVLALVALAALGACGAPSERNADDYVLPAGESWQELRAQADQVLDRYDKAVAGGVTVPPPAEAHGMNVDSATVSPSGTRLTVTFVGSPHPATEPCGTDYAAEAVESTTAVVVIVIQQKHAYSGGFCTMDGLTRTAEVNLERPLGDRAVLDVPTGQPKPVSR